jgi:hypothetical protein
MKCHQAHVQHILYIQTYLQKINVYPGTYTPYTVGIELLYLSRALH